MRLDAYMAKYWPEYSRSTWQKYIEMGLVRINDKTATSVRRNLREDDKVTHDTPPVAFFEQETLPVVYEDDHVVVINKPAGILTHAKGALAEEFSVAEFMRPRMNRTDDTNRPGIVHRLDRMTSGVIICAKDAETKKLLQKQFQDRRAHKTYLAVIEGLPKLQEAKIDLPIERNPKKPSSFRTGANGKSAETIYRILATDGKRSVVELVPRTGRTHQLRVHMAQIGHPITGDTLYGSQNSPISRLCLHAKQLEITIPVSQRKTFTADVPADLAKFMREVGYDSYAL